LRVERGKRPPGYTVALLILAGILFGALYTLAVAWALGRFCLARLAAPGTIVLAVGAAAESGLVFLLLLAGAANRVSFLVLGAACAALLYFRRRAPREELSKPAVDRVSRYVTGAILAAYGVFYLVNALAPEVQPDAIGYHLGLVSEYLRLGRFPSRVGFYEMLPQGLEMLFVPAFAFGRHSAAKLVHFAFLLATIPLMVQVGRRLHVPDYASLAAAALYFCAPVVGISGTAAYNDAALVFFVLATSYLLLAARDTRDIRYLAAAGLTAGFCYAIKMPGGVMVALAVLFVWIEMRGHRRKAIALLAGGALIPMLPWLLRNLVMSGNPVAPLFNRLFPNPYFYPFMEKQLANGVGAHGLSPWRAFYELAIGGRFDGIFGPVWLLLPLGLLALRRRAGRLLWVAAMALALPWFWNTGARFLMPALPLLALCLAMALPKPALWAVLAVQAVVCWPPVMNLYDRRPIWRLNTFPWRAALRIQPEADYLSRFDDYKIAQLIEHGTRPGERTYALLSVATAYTTREVLQFWHSAQAEQLLDTLRVASLYRHDPFFDVRAEWKPRLLWGLRLRVPDASPAEWCIHDIMLFSGEYRIYNSPQWRLHASTNVWQLPLAFDENQATRWRTWQPIRAGDYVEATFDQPQLLSGAVMTSHTPGFLVPFEFYGRDRDGWHLLSKHPQVIEKPLPDLRTAAARAIRDAGYRYILVSRSGSGNALLGAAMAGHEAEWGLDIAAYAGSVTLYRIR
jgi:Dolichyl-phosphate-mannose-protein mannosyltransferase